jgi:predicted N-acetyltransferase YhbS
MQQLEGGLILRSLGEGTEKDHTTITQFYKDTFGEAGEDDTVAMGEWVNTLISGNHPTTMLDDVWVVVDPAKDDQIVSAVLLIPQTWHYGNIPVTVGRVELVATNKDYRRRGLVRAQMNAAHERSAQLGHLMQAITGIPYYYRRFGYTMAVELGVRNTLPMYAIHPLPQDQQAKYRLRLATLEDAEQLAAWDTYRARTAALSMIRTPDLWRFEIAGRHDDEVWKLRLHIIEDTSTGEGVGYIALRVPKEIKFYSVLNYVVGENASYLQTFDDVMRGVKAYAEAFYEDKPELMPDAIYFDSGAPEAVDMMIQTMPGGRVLADTYAWYMRIPDFPAFIEHVAPVLEQRLSHSGANRYTGNLKIAFGDLDGIEMTFEQGKITGVVSRPFEIYEGDVKFPYHSFLNVVFGHHTADELLHVFPEARASRQARMLLHALFPKQRSFLFGLG